MSNSRSTSPGTVGSLATHGEPPIGSVQPATVSADDNDSNPLYCISSSPELSHNCIIRSDQPTLPASPHNSSEVIDVLWSAPCSITDPNVCRDSSIRHLLSLTLETDEVKQILVAETIENYIGSTWGVIGEIVLNIFLEAIAGIHSNEAPWRIEHWYCTRNPLRWVAHFKVFATRQLLSIMASSLPPALLEVRESIAWLEQVIGCPAKGLQMRGCSIAILDPPLDTITASISKISSDYASQHSLALESFGAPDCRTILISCEVEEEVDLHSELFRLCWVDMFDSGYIARRVVPQVKDCGEGMRTRFELLIELAAVERWIYPPTSKRGIVLTGYNTTLIPTKRLEDDSIQWHFMTAEGVKENGMPHHIDRDSSIFESVDRLDESSIEALKGTA